nr:hypothetical protein CFP56_48785 [Quercus suber]
MFTSSSLPVSRVGTHHPGYATATICLSRAILARDLVLEWVCYLLEFGGYRCACFVEGQTCDPERIPQIEFSTPCPFYLSFSPSLRHHFFLPPAMAKKRSPETASHDRLTGAAELNTRVLRRLEKALASDPEADLLSLFPSTYSERIAKKQKNFAADTDGASTLENVLQKQSRSDSPQHPDDVRNSLSADDVTTIDQLSASVQALVTARMMSTNQPTIVSTEVQFFTTLISVIQDAEIVSSEPVPSKQMVVKCGADIAAKLISGAEDFTEYTTLQYLLEHKPSIPAPKPLGLIRIGKVSIMFSSYLPGTTLEAVWADLATDQKTSVRARLDAVFRDLRTMQFPRGMALGGVAGEGCKDQRRHLRRSTVPILTAEDFASFQFSNPLYGSTIFIDFLRAFTSPSSHRIVFTHGDLRPANVIVEITENDECIIVGIVDWENSGFHPAYYEATKITNCLATNEGWDWWGYFTAIETSPTRVAASPSVKDLQHRRARSTQSKHTFPNRFRHVWTSCALPEYCILQFILFPIVSGICGQVVLSQSTASCNRVFPPALMYYCPPVSRDVNLPGKSDGDSK